MKIREIADADAREAAALLSELGYQVAPEMIPSRLEAIRGEGGVAYLAVGDNRDALGLIVLAAHAVLHAGDSVALITALVVSAKARGHGVGRALVDKATEWAKERRCVRLIVTSGEQRADAHAFYPACGLPYTGRRFGVTLT